MIFSRSHDKSGMGIGGGAVEEEGETEVPGGSTIGITRFPKRSSEINNKIDGLANIFVSVLQFIIEEVKSIVESIDRRLNRIEFLVSGVLEIHK